MKPRGKRQDVAVEQQSKVYAELWTSFAALIRSYVAANDLAKPVSNHALVDEGDGGTLTLRGERKTLDLEFDAANGTGSWTLYEDDPGPDGVMERGRFEIGKDSLVAMSGRAAKLELEVAAEAFTAKVFDEE
jgi:hypothetical protein